MKEKLRQPLHRAAAAPYPDGTVVDDQLDIPKRAGLILGEHGTCDRAAGVQQQAAFVPRDQRASPQVSADEPRRPIVLVKRVPLVPERHDVNGPTRQRRGEGGGEARGQREDLFNQNRKYGGQRAARWSETPRAGEQDVRRGRDRQWQDRDAYVHDFKSKGRAATRRKAAPRGLPGPGGGVFPRSQLIPGRVPLARLHRGAADAERARASRRASGRGPGDVRVGPCARCQPVRKCPGTSRAARRRRRRPDAAAPSAALPGPGSCRLLLPLLLLLAESELGGRPGPPPPRRAWRAGAARAGLGGRADAGGALPAGARGPGSGCRIQRSGPRQGPAEYKLINTTPKPESS